MTARIPRVASLKSVDALLARLTELDALLPCDAAPLAAEDSPLATPLALGGDLHSPNRFVVQPMEGWDGTTEGLPSDLTVRRWEAFGRSGAGWIWGGEAVAVQREGRANPHQLVIDDDTTPSLAALRCSLLDAAEATGAPEPVVGLQLTHSGRWSRPHGEPQPCTAYSHPLLDGRAHATRDSVLDDGALEALARDFGRAAALAADAGFAFVDVKHCHGYLLHEFLSARTRPGPYGGPTLDARTALTERILEEVHAAAPGLPVGVRLSVFDQLPHRPGDDGVGRPEDWHGAYPHGFGLDEANPERPDPTEPVAFARWLVGKGVRWINVTAASPYYAPHLQRPALFPPSDGYGPPEDPLVGVARLLRAARDLKHVVPELTIVSSGWTYLQEYLPHVAQACVREGWFDAVGLGRMVLSYPELPADLLAGRPLARGRICRTFSDCTTAPRNGLVSGCYPLDPFYRARPERDALERAKRPTA